MRVIAGRLGGRLIKAPPGLDVRPTYDRVRESVFGIIGERVVGAEVLDLYAGSGSLGIESLSRGASSAIFVERNSAVLSVARDNVERLGLSDVSAFVRGDVHRFLSRGALRGGPFDLVFLDPPYASGLADSTLELLAVCDRLSGACLIVAEHRVGTDLSERYGHLERSRSEVYGDTKVDFFGL